MFIYANELKVKKNQWIAYSLRFMKLHYYAHNGWNILKNATFYVSVYMTFYIFLGFGIFYIDVFKKHRNYLSI